MGLALAYFPFLESLSAIKTESINAGNKHSSILIPVADSLAFP
jgi:hypothetical protein